MAVAQGGLRALGDQCALRLREGGVQVQQQRLDVGAKLGDQERRTVRHETGDDSYDESLATGLSLVGDATGGVSVAGEDVRDLLYDVKEAAAFLRSKL